MQALYVAIAGFIILLAFEIRHRMITEELALLKTETSRLDRELLNVKEEMKKKRNIYEEYKPPTKM